MSNSRKSKEEKKAGKFFLVEHEDLLLRFSVLEAIREESLESSDSRFRDWACKFCTASECVVFWCCTRPYNQKAT